MQVGRPGAIWAWRAIGLSVASVIALLGTWLLLRHRQGWTAAGIAAALLLVAGIGQAVASQFGQPFVIEWLAERRGDPANARAIDIEPWKAKVWQAVTELRVGWDGSQLVSMTRGQPILDLRVNTRVDVVASEAGRPRVRIRGRVMPLEELTAEWDRSGGRVVILGEGGYGKTLALLVLLRHLNGTRDTARRPVAELFRLSDWESWDAANHGRPLSEWLVHSLVTTYRELPTEVARALVGRGLVVPLFDGLDEVSDERRRACVQAVGAYAGNAHPKMPFALTSRVKEFTDLGPGAIDADHHVGLVGLEPDQIVAVVQERTADLPQWEALRRRLEDGDPALLRLFRSPLRLSTALQGYDHASPDELVDLEPEAARGLLWDMFLRSDESFEGASRDQMCGWLTFVVRGMDSRGTQEFALSDLAHYAPGGERDFSSFRRQFALVGFLVVGGLTGALSAVPLLIAAHMIRSSLSAWVEVGVGIVVGLLFASAVRFHTTVAPWVASGVPWKSRWKTVRRRAIHSIVVGTLWVGAFTGLLMLGGSDLVATTAVPFLWLVICAAAVLDDVVKAGRLDAFGRPPDCLRHQGPAALLDASRRVGSRAGVIAGVVTLALPTIATLPVLLIYVRGLPADFWFEDVGLNLAAGAAFAPFVALRTAVVSGLDAWLYFHWLNRRLARRGLLPRNLPGFLEWCAHPSRQWLRATHVYEFRHRELREHLLDRDTHVAGLAGRAERI